MTAVKLSSLRTYLLVVGVSIQNKQKSPQKARQHVRWWKVPRRNQSSKIMSREGVHFSMGWPGRTSLQGTFEWELKEVRKKTLWLSGEMVPGRTASTFQGSKAVPWMSSPRHIGVDSVDRMESLGGGWGGNRKCGIRKDTGTNVMRKR